MTQEEKDELYNKKITGCWRDRYSANAIFDEIKLQKWIERKKKEWEEEAVSEFSEEVIEQAKKRYILIK